MSIILYLVHDHAWFWHDWTDVWTLDYVIAEPALPSQAYTIGWTDSAVI